MDAQPHPLDAYDTWARDLPLIGATTGGFAPLFVIFDPVFAIAAGVTGMLVGCWLATMVSQPMPFLRRHVPLSVFCTCAALVGALWGASAGLAGGFFTATLQLPLSGVDFGAPQGAPVLGMICGACAGMVQVGGLSLPYLVARAHRRSGIVVTLGVLLSPFMGWLGILVLGASLLGLWLFALPVWVVAALGLEASVRRARSSHEVARRHEGPAALAAHLHLDELLGACDDVGAGQDGRVLQHQ